MAIAATVEKHTVRPGTSGAAEPEDIVVVVPGGDLAAAFERGRALAASGKPVRVIGHGATLSATWPSWVQELPLVASELSAYRAESPFEATAEMRARYREWIDEVFAGAAPPGAASDVYFAPVVLRLFHAAFESRIFADGIAALHSHHRIHLVGVERLGLEDVLGLHKPSPGSRAREAVLPAALLAAWVAACAVTLAEVVRMRVNARASFDALDSMHSAHNEPSFWTGLVPDWDRINKHLIDAVAPELRTRRRLGVILLGTLRSGMRAEQNLKLVGRRDELWPGLGRLLAEQDRCVIEQAVQPRASADYVKAVGSAFLSSAGVVLRMARRPAPLRAAARNGAVISVAKQAAAAATMDVARSVIAERAARELVSAHDFKGRVVAFNAVNAVGYTSVECILRRAGATTLEHTHGSGGNEFYGGSESSAEIQCIWTKPEAQAFPAWRKVMVAGMPEVMKLRARTPTVPRRVLLLSNYVHRDRPYAVLPFEPFQDELLRVAALLRDAMGAELELRWRPHPADDDAAVARGHARVPFVALSKNRSLAEDLDECDVLISTQSTALVEAVLGGVPFFAHVIPGAGLVWVPPERRFFRAEELVTSFQAWVDALRRGDPVAQAPDIRARTALFGPSMRPQSLHDAIGSLMDHALPHESTP